MIHPLFRLIAAEPQMVGDHLGAYCTLFGDELRSVTTHWSRRLVLQIAAAALLAVALGLAGVSVLLWAVTASLPADAAWALVLVPLAPVAAALLCQSAARGGSPAANFVAMRRQIDADMQMLREATTP